MAGPVRLEQPALRLLCVSGRGQRYGEAWQRGLAPEIEVVNVAPADRPGRPGGAAAVRALASDLAERCQGLLDARPHAVLGHGPWALVGLELACLLRRTTTPAQLLVADCPAPRDLASRPARAWLAAWPAEEDGDGFAATAVDASRYRPPERCCSWPVTAFAVPGPGAAGADEMTWWRAVTTGSFTLRLLAAGPAGGFRPTPGVLLAIREELRTWPS